MPIANARFRFKQISPRKKVRLAFVGNKVKEVTSYTKHDGTYVRGHVRRII